MKRQHHQLWGAALPLLVAASLSVGCGKPPASRFPSGDDALEQMHATYECSRGIRGDAKVDYFGREGRVRGSMLYLAVLPEQLRLSVYSPFGVIISTLTSDGENFALYDLQNATFLQGPASTCNVARFTQAPVPPFALVQLFRGESPVLVHTPDTIQIKWKRRLKGGFYQIDIQSKHGAEQEIRLVPLAEDFDKPWAEQRVRVERVRIKQHGVVLYTAELRAHEAGRTAKPFADPDGLGEDIPPSGPPCDAPVPDRLRLHVPDTKQELVFDNEEVVLNPPLLGGDFEQPIPDGVQVLYADCK